MDLNGLRWCVFFSCVISADYFFSVLYLILHMHVCLFAWLIKKTLFLLQCFTSSTFSTQQTSSLHTLKQVRQTCMFSQCYSRSQAKATHLGILFGTRNSWFIILISMTVQQVQVGSLTKKKRKPCIVVMCRAEEMMYFEYKRLFFFLMSVPVVIVNSGFF